MALITAPDKRDPALTAKLDAVAGRILKKGLMSSWISKTVIRTIPDYPKPGIMFRDITTLLGNPRAFRRAVDELVQPYAGMRSTRWRGWKRAALSWAARWRISCPSASCRSARKASCPIP